MDRGTFEQDIRARTVTNLLTYAARTHGDRPFLRESGSPDWLSFNDAFKTARDLARGLAALGVKRGDTIPFMLPNMIGFVLAWFAVNLRGGAYVGINVNLVGELLASQLAIARSRLWIVHADYLPTLQALPETLRATVEVLVVVGLTAEHRPQGWTKIVPFEALAQQGDNDPTEQSHFLDVSAIGFTSGTTGPSKGVTVPQAQAVSTAMTFARLTDLRPDDTIYAPLPLFHGMSTRMGMLPTLLVGGRIVLGPRFSGTNFWANAIEADATVALTIFSIPNVLLAQPPSPLDRAHRVTRMYNAHHTEAFRERFGVQLIEAFGISEVGLFIASPLAEQRAGSCGRPHPDWDVAIVDEDGVPLPDNAAGEIVCRPRLPGLMMRGYLHQPERTVEATRDLWYHTGDIGRRDSDGYYWFLDRTKERIRRRGENISSMEIEDAVRRHPDVEDVAALAHPAREGEDDIRMLIVPRAGRTASEAELHAWMVSRLPRFMVPRYIELVPAIPYTATNKIEKTRLMAAGLGPNAWDAEASSSPKAISSPKESPVHAAS
jgi:crotonobetaine/carnitine-CoA ligase